MTKLSEKYEPLDVLALVVVILSTIAWIIRQEPVFLDIIKIVIIFFFGRSSKVINK